MGKYNSITKTGKNENFNLHVQRGFIEGHFAVQKSGFSTSVGTAESVIWDAGGTYTYPVSAGPVTMVATSGTNTTSNILIQGLDENYNLQQETLTLNATTTVTSAESYIRIFRTQTTNAVNIGETVNFYLDGNLTAAQIADENQSLMCLYTVPAGYEAYLNQINISSGTVNNNQFLRVRVKERNFDGVLQTKAKYTLSTSFIEELYPYPIVLDEKSDIQITGESSNQSNEVAAIFSILLIKKDNQDNFPTRSGATQ